MRAAALFLLIATAAVAQTPEPETPVSRPVAPMAELMVKLIYPFSDALFYVEREAPKNEAQWLALEAKALALAEVGNLLMTGRAVRQDQWMKDAQLLVTVAAKAYAGAKARSVEAIAALNAELYESCQSCHEHYRPGYRRRP
jgi:cytochrome c556